MFFRRLSLGRVPVTSSQTMIIFYLWHSQDGQIFCCNSKTSSTNVLWNGALKKLGAFGLQIITLKLSYFLCLKLNPNPNSNRSLGVT